MEIAEITCYERTRREHGTEVADGAYDFLSPRQVKKFGIERAWTIAVNRVLEEDRLYAHLTGAVRS